MIGKLSIQELDALLPKTRSSDRRDIMAVPEIGEDCGAVSFSGETYVVSTDPITATESNIGYLAVNIACNDVFACGGECVGVLVTLLAPPDTAFAKLREIMDDIYQNCKRLNIELLGGHTERTDGVNRIIVNTTVVGKTRRLITSSGARTGDDVVLTKFCGLEGTQILATDFAERLELSPEEEQEAEELLFQLSVGEDSRIALEFEPNAMHDVTDGGLLGALFEIIQRSGRGVQLYEKDIPVLPLTRKICRKLGLSPYRLIGSGSLLICTPHGQALAAGLEERGINAAVIGQITESERIFVAENGEEQELLYSSSDEIYTPYDRGGEE